MGPEVNNNTEVPETKEWKVDMPCRAVFSEDGLEYEGEIIAIDSQDGAQYAIVRFCGYGNEEAIWLENLIPSAGEEIRKAQIQASGAGVPTSEEPIVENQTKMGKDEKKHNVQTQEKVEKVETNGIAENKTETKVLTSTPNKVEE